MAHVYEGKTTSTHESINRSMNKTERPSKEDGTDQHFNWGHVGSVGYICEQLENIKQSFRATED